METQRQGGSDLARGLAENGGALQTRTRLGSLARERKLGALGCPAGEGRVAGPSGSENASRPQAESLSGPSRGRF